MSQGQKQSYRLHARRYGVSRIAQLFCKRGIPLELAVEVLAKRKG